MGYEGCIAHWRGKNGEITAGIPLYLLRGSKSFSIEHPQSNLFDI